MPSKSQNLPSSICSIRNNSRPDPPALVRFFRWSVTEAASEGGKIAAPSGSVGAPFAAEGVDAFAWVAKNRATRAAYCSSSSPSLSRQHRFEVLVAGAMSSPEGRGSCAGGLARSEEAEQRACGMREKEPARRIGFAGVEEDLSCAARECQLDRAN